MANTREILVLDKSALKAAPVGKLAELRDRFDFLLTDTLLHEIGTEQMEAREGLSEPARRELDAKIQANMNRAFEEAGNSWIERQSALGWEAQSGTSARTGPRLSLTEPGILDVLDAPAIQACLRYDAAASHVASFSHAAGDEEHFQRMRRMSGKKQELFDYIQQECLSEAGRERILAEARSLLLESAGRLGLEISPAIQPATDWLAYGIMLGRMVYLPWKLCRYGDGPADSKKAANPIYDMDYIGYMALADGILSGDKKQLELAWICWPEKRQSIYTFHPPSSAPRAYPLRADLTDNDPWASGRGLFIASGRRLIPRPGAATYVCDLWHE